MTTTAAEGACEVEYAAAGRRYIGMVIPATTRPRALAVLLPDWRGRTRLALDHAAHLAGLGCTALVADPYGDGYTPTAPDEVAERVQYLLTNRADGVAALSAAVDAVRRAAESPHEPVIVVAFSAGAVAALDHGRRTREPAAIVVCSGLLKTAEPDTPVRIGAPVLLIQGTQDEVSPMPLIADLVAEADAAANDMRVLLLSRTHHAFDNPEAGIDPSSRLVYSPAAAARARAAIAGLLDEIAAARPDETTSPT